MKIQENRHECFRIPLSSDPPRIAVLNVPFPMTEIEYEYLVKSIENWKAALTHASAKCKETNDA